jgi:hypothetical protein
VRQEAGKPRNRRLRDIQTEHIHKAEQNHEAKLLEVVLGTHIRSTLPPPQKVLPFLQLAIKIPPHPPQLRLREEGSCPIPDQRGHRPHQPRRLRRQHVEEHLDARDRHDARVGEAAQHLISDAIVLERGNPVAAELVVVVVRVDEVLGDGGGLDDHSAGGRDERGAFAHGVDGFQVRGGAVLVFAVGLAGVRD